MKKFLCYDTNDAASGKINVSTNGVLKPNSTVPSTNGSAYQQLVTDGDGNTKWEDRLAYDDSKLAIDVGNGIKVIKVADEVPSWASIEANIKLWESNGLNDMATPEHYTELDNGNFRIQTLVYFIITTNKLFPEKGVYFASMPNGIYVSGIASADSDTPEITWDGNIGTLKTIDPKYIPSELNEIILPSSTSGSTKKFKITVDDSGAISATQV